MTSFKPLRSGALDRTGSGLRTVARDCVVSNPFVAGHWIVLWRRARLWRR